MPMINRSVLWVRAKDPFVEWCAELEGEPGLSADELEPTAYLLSEFDADDDQDAVLRHFWDLVFEHELMAWAENESLWPRQRSYTMFSQWFDAELGSIVIDLVDAPLSSEED